jgi:hypothetical protein
VKWQGGDVSRLADGNLAAVLGRVTAVKKAHGFSRRLSASNMVLVARVALASAHCRRKLAGEIMIEAYSE